jgi:hypothetical protein
MEQHNVRKIKVRIVQYTIKLGYGIDARTVYSRTKLISGHVA